MTRHFLAVSAVLMAVVAWTSITDVVTAQSGPSVQATFYKDVAPILQKNCETCHRPGQIAPMTFQTYEATRPWARAIKNAILSKKMPPWFADASSGHILNDRSLKPPDIDTLVAWVDAGAPAGNPTDAPRPIVWPDGGWQIKPDLVVDGPTYDVPTSGVVEWTWIIVPGNFKEDTWVTSVEVKPSEVAVTHHVCLAYIPHHPDTISTSLVKLTTAGGASQFVGLMPHMHVRGKAARFYLDRPDGRTETILDVPRYDFNWQLWYDTSIKVSALT